jgi:hypothetical protein
MVHAFLHLGMENIGITRESYMSSCLASRPLSWCRAWRVVLVPFLWRRSTLQDSVGEAAVMFEL